MTLAYRPYQIEAQQAVRDAWAIRLPGDPWPMLVIATGCHPAGVRVLMADGASRDVADLVGGDLVMGPDSRPRRVTRVFRFEDRVLEVRPNKGAPWKVNPGHILSLVETSRSASRLCASYAGGRTVDVPVSEWQSWSVTGKKHTFKLFRVPVDFPPRELPIDPYAMGVLLGDGSFSSRMVRFTSVDPEVVDAMRGFAATHGLKLTAYEHHSRPPTYHLQPEIWRGVNPVLDYVRRTGMNLWNSGSKTVPHEYRTGSVEQRLQVLAGLMDTDGSLQRDGGFDYISKSPDLADSVAFLARSVGLAATVSACEKRCQTGGGGTYWRVSVSGDVDRIPCKIARKRAAPRRQKKNVLRTGFDVADLGYNDTFYGFTVDGDHRYLLDDFTVTHNCGKTETALQHVLEALECGQRVVWLAHRDELVSEPAERFCRYFPDRIRDVGIVQADQDKPRARVVFASVQTLSVARRLETVLAGGRIDLLVCDEAHHSVSRTHRQVIRALLAGGGRALALTATPDRDDGLDLGEDWEIVYSYTILDAMREGWLVPAFAALAPLRGLDRVLAQASGRRDYDDAELGAALMLEGIVEHTVQQLSEVHVAAQIPREYGEGRRMLRAKGRGVLVFTATVAQAEATAAALSAAGWNARPISGETPKDLRKRLIAGFRDGRIEVLCNAAVLTEGTDLPRAACLVLARPTKSWGLFVQMVGRGLRLYCPDLQRTDPRLNALDPAYAELGGKPDCLIIDLAGATAEHSLYAAAVLIGASRCPESPNGAHDLVATVDGKGRCTLCKKKVACIAAALAGGSGSHEWHPETNHCKHCNRPQCKLSPTKGHAMVRVADADKPRKACLYCPAEVADPLSSMYDREIAEEREPPAAAAWLRLRELEPTVCAVSLEPHGALFVVEQDAESWRPHWLPDRGRRARPITPRAVPPEQVRWMVDDLVRRADRLADLHGGFRSKRDREERRLWMTERAITLGLARRRPTLGGP